MDNYFTRFLIAILIALGISACAHDTSAISTANERRARFQMPHANGLPPDVMLSCRRGSEEARALHAEEAIRFTKACLESHDLPGSVRIQFLELLTILEIGHQDIHAALDAQIAAVDLSPAPGDSQLVDLAYLYRLNKRFAEALATLDKLEARHEDANDLSEKVGAVFFDERGWTLLGMGRQREAIEAFARGIPLQPARADAYLGRAQARDAIGDSAGAYADYQQFARWAPEPTKERPMDPAIRIKLESLGIDAARERLRPFGDTHPLRDAQAKMLAEAQAALRSATTPQEKADAYHNISVYFDGMGRSIDALRAINKALALAPDSPSYAQSKVVTLVSLGRIDEALALAQPLRMRAKREAAASANPAEIFANYREVSGGAVYAYLLRRDWNRAIDALVDAATGMDRVNEDYMALLYLYIRAKSAGSVPDNAFFEDYIQHASAPIFGDYRRSLLLYWQGRGTVANVYAHIVMLGDRAAIENALAETWFAAAAYERYVKHDKSASDAYIARLNDLRPRGTNEWMIVKRNAL